MADDRQAYAERLGADLALVGIPRMPARVLATLMTSDDGRLTSADLSGQLQASPAAISGAIRYLEQLNLVGREHQPGSRRDHYRVYEDGWMHAVRLRDQVMLRVLERFKEGAELFGEQTPAGARMADSRDFWLFVMSESDLIGERWQAWRKEHRLDEST